MPHVGTGAHAACPAGGAGAGAGAALSAAAPWSAQVPGWPADHRHSLGDSPGALRSPGGVRGHRAFPGKRGGFLRGNNFRHEARWADALKEMGVKGLHLHDLRHTGNTLAAQSGASLADLKTRMGHDSDRAALIYQHATRDADQRIADALSARVEAEQKNDDGETT
ncbi:tyrosine-type recombinase/integrase [Streptosporangium sp. NPDC002544]|uniref:tyrosine-type recombinase/integrase n=1 Tax=Streptosporangium sp. NPDC002544 TaxID=3154538 RepID=UPI003316E5EE